MIVFIFCATVYFCLDVFGIIEVPSKYSIASLFYSKLEVIASGENIYENIIPDNFDFIEKKVTFNETTEEVVAEPSDNSSQSLEDVINQMNQSEESRKEGSQEISVDADNTSRFYYNQLDEYGKIMYDKLYSNKEKLVTGKYVVDFDTTFDELLHTDTGADTLNNSFQLAINALTFDNQEFFYIDVTKMYLLTEITTRPFSKTYKVSIGGNGNSYISDEFSSDGAVQASINITREYKNEIIKKCENADTVQKIKIVHDYLVDTIDYDADAGSNVYNIYGALVDKKAVCEGYARACKYILDDLGIPCIIACGVAKNSQGNTQSHAWNYVQIDGQWYALDVTWDDPVGTGRITDEIKYAYFLKGGNNFFTDHYEDGNIVGESNFQYPKLSVLDYEY
jgi:hypothetical protein